MQPVKLSQSKVGNRGKTPDDNYRFDVTPKELDILCDLYRHVKLDMEHLAALRCHEESNRQRLRRTVLALYKRGYVHRQLQGIGAPNIIMITHRGMRALAEIKGLPSRSANAPRGTVRNQHDLDFADFTVNVDLSLREIPDAQFIDEAVIYARSSVPKVRKKHAWPVTIRHRGHEREFWIKPDRLHGVFFSERPTGHNSRYYAIEQDTGSMQVDASNLEVPSILRKLLVYEQTHKHRLFDRYFGIHYCYILFITKSVTRRDNMIALAGKVVREQSALDTMLFAMKPDKPNIGNFTNPKSLAWINGRGTEVNFPC